MGFPDLVACVGVLRRGMGDFVGGFSTFLGIQSSLFVEFMGAIIAIEHAKEVSQSFVARE